MKTLQTTKKWMVLAIFLFLAGTVRVQAQPESPEPPRVVGRVYEIEGDLLRYVPETRDWVTTVKDAPFSTEDTLYSGTEGRTELIVPNRTWIRLGNSTQIQVIGLASDLTEVDVASGEARFGNKSDQVAIKATSDFGYVLADAGTIFDFCVGDNSAEVIPVKGTVTFVHSVANARYSVAAGSLSLLADSKQVSSGDGAVDSDWDRWNATRDAFWAEKAQARPRSAQYLPPDLHDESYILDDNGQWETVAYEGRDRTFWRPRNVPEGWAPFTVGRWSEWNGDQTWIPAEPFGYMTHHYGNWVYAGSGWYWAPPMVSVNVGDPRFNVGFNWNPGRVSWIHRDGYVGWVPLAPQETYYSHRRWGGHHDEMIGDDNLNVQVNIGIFSFIAHAIIVEQNHFCDERDYSRVRVTNINRTTIINNYYAAPVVNNTVINNYTVNNNRYNYTNEAAKRKPHSSVLARIDRNEKVIRGGRREKAIVVQGQVNSIPEGRINRDVKVAPPVVTERIVPVSEVSRPESEVKFKQRVVKTKNDQGNRPVPAAEETKRGEIPPGGVGNSPVPPVGDTKRVEIPKVEIPKVEIPEVGPGRRPTPPAGDSKRLEIPENAPAKRVPLPAEEPKKVKTPRSGREKQPAPPVAEPKKVETPRNSPEKRVEPPVEEAKKVKAPPSGREKQPAPPVEETK
ncbi:MAG TPA: hypothetical protein PKH31_13570, partial [Candidatus Sumerlaeota bacterium]|nr:hypothetical protein [Candidatus Sumerlaeota bacterium]